MLDHSKLLATVRVATLDTTNQAAINEFKKLLDVIAKLAFPESYKPAEFEKDEFEEKLKILEQQSEKYIKQIKKQKNYVPRS